MIPRASAAGLVESAAVTNSPVPSSEALLQRNVFPDFKSEG